MMSHEQIRQTLSGMMQAVFDSRLQQLQDMKQALGNYQPSDAENYEDEWIAEIGIDEMLQYFEGSNTDDRDKKIELAMDTSNLFRSNMIDVGYMQIEKMLNMKLKF